MPTDMRLPWLSLWRKFIVRFNRRLKINYKNIKTVCNMHVYVIKLLQSFFCDSHSFIQSLNLLPATVFRWFSYWYENVFIYVRRVRILRHRLKEVCCSLIFIFSVVVVVGCSVLFCSVPLYSVLFFLFNNLYFIYTFRPSIFRFFISLLLFLLSVVMYPNSC